MDLNDSKKKSQNSALKLERSLLKFLKKLQKHNIGAKRKDIVNKGFFYFFCRNRFYLGYCLSNAMKKNHFDDVSKNRIKMVKLIKAWSAKFSRYCKGSSKAVEELEIDDSKVINYPTLANQLSVADLMVLTEGLSDQELIDLLRPKK